MAFNQKQVEDVRDKLDRALALHLKQKAVKDANMVPIGDSDDLSITTNQLVLDYIAEKKAKRDALIADIQPVVAAWVP